MTKEQWKDIQGYNGLYQVSSIGRVKRVEREVMQFNHQLQKEIPIKYPKKYLKFDLSKGYNRVTLSKENNQKRFLVHRLVAEYFLPNPEDKPHIHHINHHREDNRVENLMWVTPRENEFHKHKANNMPFKAVDPEGNETVWYVQMNCARTLGLNKNGIFRCLHGEVESYRGYKFSYINRPLEE